MATNSTSVITPDRRQSRAKKKTVSMPERAKAHQIQLPAIPPRAVPSSFVMSDPSDLTGLFVVYGSGFALQTAMLEKFQALPGIPVGAKLPGMPDFGPMAMNPMQFWMQTADMWQKNGVLQFLNGIQHSSYVHSQWRMEGLLL